MIKTKEGKVITKGGKVSCTCCETGCCMYPASLLGVSYTDDDLPDELLSERFGVFLRKLASPYENIYYNAGAPWYHYWTGDTWQLVEFVDGDAVIRSESPCLIGDGVVDQFEEQYTLTLNGTENFGHICGTFSPDDTEVTLTRISQCVWAGEMDGLFFHPWVDPPEPCHDGFRGTASFLLYLSWDKWEVNFDGTARPKDNQPQNDPLGDYYFGTIS